MRKFYGSFLAVLLATSFACALPPDVPKEVPVKAGKVAYLEVKLTAGQKIGYAPGFDKNTFPVVRLYNDDPLLMQFMLLPDSELPDGDYYITFWDTKEQGYSQTLVKVTGGKKRVDPTPVPPKPEPAPDPKPKPDPAPVTPDIYLIVVEENSQRTPGQAAVLNDTPAWNAMPVLGWKHYDKDQQACKEKGYDQMAANAKDSNGKPIGLPVMLAVGVKDGVGYLVRAEPLPSVITGVKQFVREVTGK